MSCESKATKLLQEVLCSQKLHNFFNANKIYYASRLKCFESHTLVQLQFFNTGKMGFHVELRNFSENIKASLRIFQSHNPHIEDRKHFVVTSIAKIN